ncbi:MAG: hypothetical protein A3F70_01730 [Acidobacteria bacterium RIFCSPLOWO2_12_FULL_67_14]|nr:MAG: hypothetical protein A3F70_01730 [Acidobacteria bacterium RIFCSPLOWO2_12_FULL_67_14]
MMTRAWTMRIATIALVTVFVMVTAGDTAGQPPRGVTIAVPGIPGPYCMYGIEKRLAEMPEIEQIDLRWDAEEIRITVKRGASVTRQQLEDAIERAEYPYKYSIVL